MADASVDARLQERLSRRPAGWEDMVLAALAGDPVFYGVMTSITICILAFVGLLAAKVLLDQLEEEDEAAAAATTCKSAYDRSDASGDDDDDDKEEESKKQQ